MDDSVNDQQLLSQIAESDKNAFETIYRRYWTELYDAVYQRLKNTTQAEDIVQEIFIKIWQRREKLNILNLKAYLHAAVRYNVYNCVRRNIVTESFYEPFEAIATCSANSDAGLIEKDLIRLIDAYIDTLPKKRREIFILSFKENLSTKEIAAQLNVSQKTVQNQLGVALQELRRRLSPTIFLLFLLYW